MLHHHHARRTAAIGVLQQQASISTSVVVEPPMRREGRTAANAEHVQTEDIAYESQLLNLQNS